MSHWLQRVPSGIFVLIGAAAVAGAAAPHGMQSHAPLPEVGGFAADNARAMDRMMAAMTVTPSGNVDRDFVAMMVPHHQGAIDMALAELRYGKDETLRRMAQEIIVEQQQEIVAMHLAADRIAAATPIAPMALDICRSRPLHAHRMQSPPLQGDI